MSFLKSSTQKSTIVITGGASGIGLAFAKQLIGIGHSVIVAGRKQAQLEFAKSQVPELKTIQADISTDAGRVEFHHQVITEYPEVNVLINNAGVLDQTSLLKNTTDDDFAKYKSEIAVNLEAPIHLSILFLPHLQKHNYALIANVTSVIAFFPAALYPLYSATKAGLHSFTISLRHQLKNTSVEVFEIAPPAVKTAMNPSEHAMDPAAYAHDTIAQLTAGKNVEIGVGDFGAPLFRANRDTLDTWTDKFANWVL